MANTEEDQQGQGAASTADWIPSVQGTAFLQTTQELTCAEMQLKGATP